MLSQLQYTVSRELLKIASTYNAGEFRQSINKPSGDFFYDPWTIKEEFIGSPWEKILQTLPYDIGEARIITLNPGTCYTVHADIDDRYHLAIAGDYSYLVDLNNNNIHKTDQDGIWYDMDAGQLHSAVNFGRLPRIQLVVRKLLTKTNLKNPVDVKVTTNISNLDKARFEFDQQISCWLNRANKKKIISEFSYVGAVVSFKLESEYIEEFKQCAGESFNVEIT
jgi:hypothetical protein